MIAKDQLEVLSRPTVFRVPEAPSSLVHHE